MKHYSETLQMESSQYRHLYLYYIQRLMDQIHGEDLEGSSLKRESILSSQHYCIWIPYFTNDVNLKKN